jgi:hypothetical protein
MTHEHYIEDIFKSANLTEEAELLVRVECVCCPWLMAETKVATILDTFFSMTLEDMKMITRGSNIFVKPFQLSAPHTMAFFGEKGGNLKKWS